MRNGIVLKDVDETYLSIILELERQNDKEKKMKIPDILLNKVKEQYLLYKETQEDRYYYQLLEDIRRCYHYKKNCSDISMAKVFDIYSDDKKYSSYELNLPKENFRKSYLLAIEIKGFKERLEAIRGLLEIIDFKMSNVKERNNFKIMSFNVQLAILYYHKIESCMVLIEKNHPYKNMFYNLILNEMKLYLGEEYERGIKLLFEEYQVPMYLERSYGKIRVG